jgi:non-ribosomal peptide synthetase component F
MLHKNPFLESLALYPKHIALTHPSGDLTYEALGKLVEEYVTSPLFSANSIASIGGYQTLDEYIKIFAGFASGKPYFPLNPKFPPERIEKIESAVSTFIQSVDSDTLSKLAYIIFTSGSTGEPKGVPITRIQLANYCTVLQDILHIHEQDRVLQLGDFSFDISIMAMAIAWPNGASLCAVPSAHILMAPRYAEDLAITVWLSVPSVVALAAKAGLLQPNSLPHIRIAIFGGEALTAEVIRIFSKAAPNARLFNFWGPTEGTISLAHFAIDPDLAQTTAKKMSIMPLGHPHPGVELALWDEEIGQFVSNQGHLCASSPQLTNGYLNRPDLSEGAFFVHEGRRWYRTGDIAAYEHQYGYHYLGRADRQIKFKGYRIELQECEAALRQASQALEVCVVPWLPSNGNIDRDLAIKGLVGFVVAPVQLRSPEIWLAEIEMQLLSLLPSYMIPQRIILLDTLPLNGSGKVDYKALEKQAREMCF